MAIPYHEITADERFTSGARTLTEADMMAPSAAPPGDFSPLHADEIMSWSHADCRKRLRPCASSR